MIRPDLWSHFALESEVMAYRFISQDLKAHLTRLDKGELLLSHPIYRQPVKIEFPRPAYQSIGHE